MKTHPHLELVRKYARATKRAVLSHDEKSKMRQELLQHIKASPAAVPSEAIPVRAPRFSSPYAKYLKRAGKVVAPLMLVIIIGGGTSYAAESSLPGDLLYPVKIHVNENVVSDLSFSALSQAKWAVQKVKRRLAEAKAIGLQAAAKVGLDATVVAETDDADAKIAALDTSDPTDAGALTQQLAGLVQADGMDASTSPIEVDLSTSTDTTSTQVSNKIHTVAVPSVSPKPASPVVVVPVTASASASATIGSSGSSNGGAHLNASVGATANVNANASVSLPAVPAVSTPTVTTPTVSVPAVSVPAVSAPAVTVPPVTVPAVTVPSVSVPSAAASAASAVSSVKSSLGL